MTNKIVISIHKRIMESITKYPKQINILDMGCGKGELITKLRNKGYKNTCCCDIKPVQLPNFIKLDIEQYMNYEPKQFDVIILSEVIEHIHNKERLLKQCKKMLKDNGSLIITTPNIYNIFNKLYFLFRNKFFQFHEFLELNSHISPLFRWQIRTWKVKEMLFNRTFIPIIRISFNKSNSMLGENVIYILQKDG